MAKQSDLHRLVDDDDGHWYVIRVEEEKSFAQWLDAAPYWEGYKGKDFDQCRVDGPHTVQFASWSEIDH